MIIDLPSYIPFLFGLTVLLTIGWFHAATRSKSFLFVVIGWTLLQSALGLAGVFQDTEAMPPKLLLFGVFPTLAGMLILFVSKKGKAFMDSIDLRTLTYFHSIRIPVEATLAMLFHMGFVSQYMTYEGTNFDIFSGVTASLVGYLAFKNRDQVNSKLLWVWNIICVILLFNVVITAALAIPSPIQKIAFDQPNVAVLYFPFNLLPSIVVPLVLFGHLVAFRQLRRKKRFYNYSDS